MDFLDRKENTVIRLMLDDAVRFAGGELLFSDNSGAAVRIGDRVKCALADPALLNEYRCRYRFGNKLCLLGAPLSAPEALGFKAEACKSFAYTRPLPPPLCDVPVKRLAHTLAGVVAENYRSRGHGYTEAEAAELMRDKGVFGAFIDSRLAGFVGRHADGNMGMLVVFEGYRRRGIGEALARFIINYVMTFGRTPLCDVYADNAPSIALQHKLGMQEAPGYTFWTELDT